MITLFRQILETVLFPEGLADSLVLVPELPPDADQEHQGSGSFYIPRDLFPKHCEVRELPGGEAFISALGTTISKIRPQRLFIFPPMLSYRELSEGVRSEFRRMDLQEIVLQVVVESLTPGSLVGVTLPRHFFGGLQSSDLRNHLIENASPRFIIAHDHSWQALSFDIHAQFRMYTLILEIGQGEESIVRFFKCPKADGPEQQEKVISDLRRLSAKGGGQTEYGYVLRKSLPPDTPWLFDTFHPELRGRVEDFSYLGDVRPLSDLVDIQIGPLHHIGDEALLIENDTSDRGVPVIEARDIRPDGSLIYKETRYKAEVPINRQLQPGDICVRGIFMSTDTVPVVLAEVEESMLPLTAMNSVVILRPKPETSPEDIELLIPYLRSPLVVRLLEAQGAHVHLNMATLRKLPVPVPDESLKVALRSLNRAAAAFDGWKTEAERAIYALFDFQSAKDARLYLLSTGQRVRQRHNAAQLVDDFKYRARTRFPHPIAYRWRTVEAAKPNIEGYIHVLECAEVAVCYLASVAIVLARNIEGVEIRRLEQIARRLTDKGHGTNMGDWIAILREVRDSKQFRNVSELVPFYEILRFLNDQEADVALQRLKERRDDQAHGRGPKGHQLEQAFVQSLADLKVLLQVTEFLSEYPLRYVEDTRRDSLQAVTGYHYRDLMGDHPLVPISQGATETSELEAGSLYLVDRTGELHLLRPLLNRRICPKCGRWTTFYLDAYLKDDDRCVLKGMEHGDHTIQDSEISGAFRHVGLLPVHE